jgi:PDZ domain-containing protein
MRASALLLGAALWPGVRLVHRSVLVPPGESPAGYDRILVQAMQDSQHVAAFVAERAAGLRVPMPPERIVVADILSDSPALGLLRVGDRLLRVNGAAVEALRDVANAAGSGPPGLARVELERDGRTLTLDVPTMRTTHGVRLGILVRARGAAPALPVPVHFAVDDISGSSGGLMFALDIYASLRPARAQLPAVAGTGTLAPDGHVGPVEGTRQKLIAARSAGASLFFVPRENYAEVASENGLRIVPVSTFAEALRALKS